MRSITILSLLLALTPAGAAAQSFHMTVRDAFTITGRGVVLTGMVEGGPVSVDDVVCLRPTEGDAREVTVAGVEIFRRVMETAEPGAMVGLLFEGIEVGDVDGGGELTASCE